MKSNRNGGYQCLLLRTMAGGLIALTVYLMGTALCAYMIWKGTWNVSISKTIMIITAGMGGFTGCSIGKGREKKWKVTLGILGTYMLIIICLSLLVFDGNGLPGICLGAIVGTGTAWIIGSTVNTKKRKRKMNYR